MEGVGVLRVALQDPVVQTDGLLVVVQVPVMDIRGPEDRAHGVGPCLDPLLVCLQHAGPVLAPLFHVRTRVHHNGGIRLQLLGPLDQRQSFVFRYKITMTNVGADNTSTGNPRLLSRHWIIVDGEGRREEVRGRGVVGEFPQLAIGESYSYVSYCPLATSWGTMEGTYTFERGDGSRFEVSIGRFFLVPTAPPLQLESPSV